MLRKWYVRWQSERNRSWNQWLCEKYHITKGTPLNESFKDSKLSFVLSSILSALETSKSPTQRSASSNMHHSDFLWDIGDGNSILFWHDYWSKQGQMSKLFPKLYTISSVKDATLRSFIVKIISKGICDSSLWSRSLRQWEKDEAANLLKLIGSVKFLKSKDQLRWKLSGKPFTVKDCYLSLLGQLNPSVKNLPTIMVF